METQQTPTQVQPQPPVLLTQEERNDLRKRVLAGIPLTLEEAKQVLASTRQGSATAILSAGEKPEKKSRSKKPTLSDEALDKDLEGLGL